MPNNENDAVKATREKLEGIRNSLYAKYGEKGARRVVVLSAVGIVALVALLILIFLYPVREISVSGEVTMFNEGEIIADIQPGDNIDVLIEGLTGYTTVRIAGESAAFSIAMTELQYDLFQHE